MRGPATHRNENFAMAEIRAGMAVCDTAAHWKSVVRRTRARVILFALTDQGGGRASFGAL